MMNGCGNHGKQERSTKGDKTKGETRARLLAHSPWLPCEPPDQLCCFRIQLNQLIWYCIFIVGIVESWRHGCAHQRPFPSWRKLASLPHSAAHDHLRLLSGAELKSKCHSLELAIWMELQHHHGVAEIEVKNLAARQPM